MKIIAQQMTLFYWPRLRTAVKLRKDGTEVNVLVCTMTPKISVNESSCVTLLFETRQTRTLKILTNVTPFK